MISLSTGVDIDQMINLYLVYLKLMDGFSRLFILRLRLYIHVYLSQFKYLTASVVNMLN